jgi:hypothetical protein
MTLMISSGFKEDGGRCSVSLTVGDFEDVSGGWENSTR